MVMYTHIAYSRSKACNMLFSLSTFPTLPGPPGVSMNHMTLHFNNMIAGFTFGENKHRVEKVLYFSHRAEKSEVWGQMPTVDFTIQNAIMYQKCTRLLWQNILSNSPYFVQDEIIKM